MPTCPKGHESVAIDYCDECGTPIGAPSPPPPATPAGTPPAPPSSSPASSAPAPPGASGEPCPECQTPRDGRFCETCGHDFLAEATPTPAQAAPAGTAAGPGGIASSPASPAPSSSPPAGAERAAGTEWRVVVTADRDYHARMMAVADADAEPVDIPVYYPERRYTLTGAEVLIGRHSRSRGIEPGVDLAGPPEDAAVSHMHALLVRTPEGTWNLVDLDSANGTYVNESTTPIAPNQPVPLADGDRIHVGAWTTLTLTTLTIQTGTEPARQSA